MSENQVIPIGANPSLHSAVSHFDFSLIGNDLQRIWHSPLLFFFSLRLKKINNQHKPCVYNGCVRVRQC